MRSANDSAPNDSANGLAAIGLAGVAKAKPWALILAATTLMGAGAGCGARRVTDFTVISTKNTLLVAGAERRDRRVKGEDCVFILLGVPNMKAAIDDAIEKAGPGYDALVDGVVSMEDRVLFQCYTVEGTPLCRSELAGTVVPSRQPDIEEQRDDVSRTAPDVDDGTRTDSDVAKNALDTLVDDVKSRFKPGRDAASADADPDPDERETADAESAPAPMGGAPEDIGEDAYRDSRDDLSDEG